MNRACIIATLVVLASACSSAGAADEISFPLPEDPVAADHPWPATRQLGPSGLALPAGAVESYLPADEDGDRGRALFARMREQVTELDGAGVSAIVRAPYRGDLDVGSLSGEVEVLDERGGRTAIEATVADHALEIRGARPWDGGATYVVVVKRPRGTAGGRCRPSDGVRTLLSEGRSGDAFDAERPVVRGALARAGIDPSGVCLAFSFHVQDVRAKVLALRDGIAALPTPAYAITEIRDARTVTGLERSQHVDRVVYGTYDAPDLRDVTGRIVPARLDGRESPPIEKLRFALSLPRNAAPPYRVIMGIHGLGGSIESTLPGYAEYLGEGRLAYLTMDGVAHGTRATPGTNASTFIFEREDPRETRDILRQTLAELYSLRKVVSSGLSLDGKGDTLARTGIGWSGGSYGGIFGTMMAATDPGIEAAHVEACGAPWREAIAHSEMGRGFATILFAGRTGLNPSEPAFATGLGRFLEVTQWVLDSIDASSLAEFAARHPLDGSPKRILMQYWIGDTLMPRVASEALVRALAVAEQTTAEDATGTRAVWSYDNVEWGAPTGLDGHQAFWRIREARKQALGFLVSGGTKISAPAALE